MKELKARPSSHDYLAEVRERLKNRASLCNLQALGQSSDRRKPYVVSDRVAIINISGYLCNEAMWWDETEYGQIQKEVRMAVADADVDGILLRINSPGGETENAFETAAVLAEAGKKKRIWSVADTIAYSGGYLMACNAARIYVPPITGGVGSIGVYMMHVDYSQMLAKAGVKVTFLTAGEGKAEGNPYQPLSEEAEASFLSEVQRLYGEFVGAVSRGRKMSDEQIREIGAWTYPGAKRSIGAGLADAAGSLEDAWLAMATAIQQKTQFPSAAASAVTSPQEVSMADTTRPAEATAAAAAPPNIEQVRTEADAAGFDRAAEIAELCEIAGKPEMATGFIREKKSVPDVRKALREARTKERSTEEISNASMPGSGTEAKPQKTLKQLMVERLQREGRAA